jgi:hypothetical protein
MDMKVGCDVNVVKLGEHGGGGSRQGGPDFGDSVGCGAVVASHDEQ